MRNLKLFVFCATFAQACETEKPVDQQSKMVEGSRKALEIKDCRGNISDCGSVGTNVIWHPLEGRTCITQTPCDHTYTPHENWDLRCALGDPIGAPISGVVMDVPYVDGMEDACVESGGYGNRMCIRNEASDLICCVNHLQRGSLQVAPERTVSAGEHIADCGCSGRATGPHLDIYCIDLEGNNVELAHPDVWVPADCGGGEVADYEDNDGDGAVDETCRVRLNRLYWSNGHGCHWPWHDWDHCFSVDGINCIGENQGGGEGYVTDGFSLAIYPLEIGSGAETIQVSPHTLARLESCYHADTRWHVYATFDSREYLDLSENPDWTCASVGYVRTGSGIAGATPVYAIQIDSATTRAYTTDPNEADRLPAVGCGFTQAVAWYGWTPVEAEITISDAFASMKDEGESEAEAEAEPVCGNGVCENPETCSTCSADCGPCDPVCGNGVCDGDEACGWCPEDCGECAAPEDSRESGVLHVHCTNTVSAVYRVRVDGCVLDEHGEEVECRDGWGEAFRTTSVVADIPLYRCQSFNGVLYLEHGDREWYDCGAICTAVWGDSDAVELEVRSHFCDDGCGFRIIASCDDPDAEYCGDCACNRVESCASCPADCGVCPLPVCGDRECNGDETCSTCSGDCGICCGNGMCGIDETCRNCPSDCGSCPLETCDGTDNDFDGEVDEGVLNACGTCGPVPLETCDGADNDCDGETDEDQGSTVCGLGVCEHTQQNCAGGALITCDPFAGFSDETCDGILDENCNGAVDEGCECVNRAVQDCSINPCGNLGTRTCTDGVWDVCDGPACPPPVVCGDDACTGDETCRNCSADCGQCCGDGACARFETCSSCPEDCDICPPVCGDRECNGDETCSSCSGDCGVCPPRCGDDDCNGTETCLTCPADCGPCCGNGSCGSGESCSSCPADCGACPPPAPRCGDGNCNGSENCSSCSADCECAPIHGVLRIRYQTPGGSTASRICLSYNLNGLPPWVPDVYCTENTDTLQYDIRMQSGYFVDVSVAFWIGGVESWSCIGPCESGRMNGTLEATWIPDEGGSITRPITPVSNGGSGCNLEVVTP